MAGKLRHWKEKGGRFYARVAVPKPLIPYVGRSELLESLGGDRRAAMRKHPGAVAVLQAQIISAERQAAQAGAMPVQEGRFLLTPAQIAASHYIRRLAFDDELRNDPRYALIGIDDQLARQLRDGLAGKLRDVQFAETIGLDIEHFRRSEI